MSEESKLYYYKAKVTRILDGDTVDAVIDMGFDISVKKRIRFLGIDAYETRTKDLEEKAKGLKAKAYMQELIDNVDGSIIINSINKSDAFGRVLAVVYAGELNLCQEMLDKGHAVVYKR